MFDPLCLTSMKWLIHFFFLHHNSWKMPLTSSLMIWWRIKPEKWSQQRWAQTERTQLVLFTVNLIHQSLTDVSVNVCPYRQCSLLYSHIKSRRSHGWPLVKTATTCPRSGRRRMAFTLTFSLTLLWRRGLRKCLVGFWLMTWGWWDDLRFVLLVLNISPTSAQNVYAVFQGKTLTTIALIVSNFHNGKPLPLEQCVRCRWKCL